MYSHPVREGRGWLSTVPQATSKKALVNVVLSLVQAHEKFRAQLRKYSRLLTIYSPLFFRPVGHIIDVAGFLWWVTCAGPPHPPSKQYHPILLKFAFFLLYAQTDLNQPCSYLPVKPAIWILFMNPAGWFPHFQASSTFDFVCIDFIAIQWWSNLRFDVQSLKPVRGKFLVHLRRIFLAFELS